MLIKQMPWNCEKVRFRWLDAVWSWVSSGLGIFQSHLHLVRQTEKGPAQAFTGKMRLTRNSATSPPRWGHLPRSSQFKCPIDNVQKSSWFYFDVSAKYLWARGLSSKAWPSCLCLLRKGRLTEDSWPLLSGSLYEPCFLNCPLMSLKRQDLTVENEVLWLSFFCCCAFEYRCC